MIEIDSKFPIGTTGKYILNNKLSILIKKRSDDNKFYYQLKQRIFRIALLSDTIYSLSSRKRKKLDIVEAEYIAMLIELYFLYLRTLYDYLCLLIEKETEKKQPASFRKFLKNIKVNKSELKLKSKFIYFIKKDTGFEKLKSIRDSIKMGTPLVKVWLEKEKLLVEFSFCHSDKKVKEKCCESGRQLIFNYSAITAIWMHVISDMLINNNSSKNFSKK
jgi:hypothetical protein